MEGYISQSSAYDKFRQEFERMLQKDRISEQEFLSMAKRAVDTYAQEPNTREKIAYKMTGLWLVIEDKMGEKYIEQHPAIAEIGGEFADLEMPDAHISLEGYTSVEERWYALSQRIEELISSLN